MEEIEYITCCVCEGRGWVEPKITVHRRYCIACWPWNRPGQVPKARGVPHPKFDVEAYQAFCKKNNIKQWFDCPSTWKDIRRKGITIARYENGQWVSADN